MTTNRKSLDEVDQIALPYRAVVEAEFAAIRHAAATGKGFYPQIMVSKLGGESHGISFASVDIQVKELAAEQARTVARILDADYSLVTAEAWALSAKDIKRHSEILDKYGSYGNYPNRLEVFTFSLETRSGCWYGSGRIFRKGGVSKKRFSIGPIKVVEGAMEGVLTGFIERSLGAVPA